MNLKLRTLLTLIICSLVHTHNQCVQEQPIIDDEMTTLDQSMESPPDQSSEEDLAMPMDIPVIGEIILYPYTESGQSGFKTYLPPKGKQLFLGPLTIESSEFRQTNNTLSYASKAKLFGSEGQIVLKKADPDETKTQVPPIKQGKKPTKKHELYSKFIFELDFPHPPTLTLMPNHPAITLESVSLILDKTNKKQPLELTARSKIFGQEVVINFAIGNKKTDIWAVAQNVSLVDIMPEVKGTPLETTHLHSFTLTVKNIISRTKAPIQLLINGTANLGTIEGIEAGQELKDSAIKVIIDKNGPYCQASVNSLTIPGLGTIKDALFIANFRKDKIKKKKRSESMPTENAEKEEKKEKDETEEEKKEEEQEPQEIKQDQEKETAQDKVEEKIEELEKTEEEDKTEKEKTSASTAKQKKKSHKKEELKNNIELRGSAHITIPEIGDFDVELEATLNKKGIAFSSYLAQTLTFAGVNIEDVYIQFSSANKSFKLFGDAEIKDYKTVLVLDVAQIKGRYSVSGVGQITEKTIYPFPKSDIPTLKNLALDNPEFLITKKGAEYDIVLSSDITMFGGSLHGELSLKKNKKGKTSELLEIATPPTWKLSDGMPVLKATLFDDIVLDTIILVISSDDFEDTDRKITFKKGINFIANTKLTKALAPVGRLTTSASTTTSSPSENKLVVIGYIPENPLAMTLSIELERPLPIKADGIAVKELSIEVGTNTKVKPPRTSFSLHADDIEVKPTPKDDKALVLSADITYAPPTTFSLSGTMLGKWVNPFGIKGLEIGSDDPNSPVQGVAVQMMFDLKKFPITGMPENLGIAAALTLGKRHIAMAAKIPIGALSGPSAPGAAKEALGSVIYGSVDELTLSDLVDTAQKMAKKKIPNIDSLPLNDIGLKDTKLYIVPIETKIGQMSFDPGLTFDGTIFMPGFKAYGHLNVSDSGILAQAFCTEVNFGPLKITKSDKETPSDTKEREEVLSFCDEAETETDKKLCDLFKTGPMMHLDLSLFKQELLVSGKISVAGIFENESYISLSKNGFAFDFRTALGPEQYNGQPLLQSEIKGQSSGSLDKPQFTLTITFEQNLQKYIIAQTKLAIKKAHDDVHNKLGKAIADTANSMQQAQASIATVSTQVTTSTSTANTQAQQSLQDAQAQVDSLQKDIDHLNDMIASHEQTCSLIHPKDCAYIVQDKLDIAGKQASMAIATAALDAAKALVQGSIGAGNTIAQGAISIGSGSVQATNTLTHGVLTKTEQTAHKTLAFAEQITQQILEGFDIQNITYQGDLESLANGVLGNVSCTAMILGTPTKITFSLDVKKPINSIANLITKIVDQISSIIATSSKKKK